MRNMRCLWGGLALLALGGFWGCNYQITKSLTDDGEDDSTADTGGATSKPAPPGDWSSATQDLPIDPPPTDREAPPKEKKGLASS